jgi:hypothetical protein
MFCALSSVCDIYLAMQFSPKFSSSQQLVSQHTLFRLLSYTASYFLA